MRASSSNKAIYQVGALRKASYHTLIVGNVFVCSYARVIRSFTLCVVLYHVTLKHMHRPSAAVMITYCMIPSFYYTIEGPMLTAFWVDPTHG